MSETLLMSASVLLNLRSPYYINIYSQKETLNCEGCIEILSEGDSERDVWADGRLEEP